MASRARRRGVEQNLDSLLDTMANVTGILVVMLAVVQISTGDAAGRLRELLAQRPELTAESLALATEQAEAIRAELAPLAARDGDLTQRRREAGEELASLRAESARLRKEIAAASAGGPEALRARLRDAAAREQALRGDLARAKQEQSELLERAAAADEPARRAMRLPDRRPAPAGAREVAVVVRYGHAHVIDVRGLIQELERGVERALQVPLDALSMSLLPVHQRVRLSSYFDRIPIGVGGLRWRIAGDGADLVAVLEWRSRELGETTAEIEQASSDFQRELRRTSPNRAFLRYIVWADSFDTYLAARQISDGEGFAAGFEPYEDDDFGPIQPLTRPTTTRGFVD
jgi:hypothetical protein